MAYYHSLSQGDSYEILDQCLKDILLLVKPTQYDQTKREYIINELRPVVQRIERDAVVRPFGSFVSNLYTKGGDLDISIELSHCTSKKKKTSLLWKIRNALVRQKHEFAREINLVPYARVPVLAFESRRGNISCDITINNQLGYVKSRIFSWISQIDERFRDMVLLRWSPAILPPLKEIYEGNIAHMTGSWSDHERQIEDKCAANIAKFMIFRQKNPSSLSELLISFFDTFKNIDRDASKLVICPYTGTFEDRESNPIWMEKSCNLLVADPFDQNDNPARSVSSVGLTNISETFTSTYQKLCLNSVLSDRDALLAILVRPNISSDLRVSTINPSSEELQIEYSGLTMHGPEHEPEFKVRRDSNMRFSTQKPTTTHRPWVQYSRNMMHGREHERERGARRDSNSWSSTQNPTFQGPQAEYSGLITHGPIHEPRPNVRRDSSGSSSTRNHTPQGALVEYPGLITPGPEPIRILRRDNNNASSLIQDHTFRGKGIRQENSPQVEISGHILHSPVGEPVLKATNHDSTGQSSSTSAVTKQRQGPHVWRPKSSNRSVSSLSDQPQ